MSLRAAWSTERVPGQPKLIHRKTLSQKKNITNKQTNKNYCFTLCVQAHVYFGVQVEVPRQFLGVDFLLPSCGMQGLNTCHPACAQVPLPAEFPHQPTAKAS